MGDENYAKQLVIVVLILIAVSFAMGYSVNKTETQTEYVVKEIKLSCGVKYENVTTKANLYCDFIENEDIKLADNLTILKSKNYRVQCQNLTLFADKKIPDKIISVEKVTFYSRKLNIELNMPKDFILDDDKALKLDELKLKEFGRINNIVGQNVFDIVFTFERGKEFCEEIK